MEPGGPPQPSPLRLRDVFETWWPLAASWRLMGCELPLVTAALARLPDPTVSLAAYGGVVFPLALVIESPIIMMLPASTALSRDWASYRLVRRVMWAAASSLTAFHALLAFTPLFGLLVGGVLGVPEPVREPARRGLQIMLPWTLAIAYRRFQQGVLIRWGHPRAVGVGTVVRVGAIVAALGVGSALGRAPGIVVGTLAVAAGVVSEAVYAGWRVRPVLRDQLRPAPPLAEPLALPPFARFYAPLALTPLILLAAMPMTSAGLSRMREPLESLAVWPVVNGLVFMFRSLGFALNEVVVSLLDRPNAVAALAGFTRRLAGTVTLLVLLVAATPLGSVWFAGVAALPPPLAAIARVGVWLAVILPALSVYQSWYQGAIVHGRRTRAVTESVLAFLAATGLVLAAGIALGRVTGLYAAQVAWGVGGVAQVAWLWKGARPTFRGIRAREEAEPPDGRLVVVGDSAH